MKNDPPKKPAAAKCPHGLSCRTTGKCGPRDLCKVAYANGDDVLFLDGEGASLCPYCVVFGGRQVCTCPVHFERFRKERV